MIKQIKEVRTKTTIDQDSKEEVAAKRTKEKIKGIMAMLKQSKKIERELIRSSITTPKLERAIELSEHLDKMVVDPTEELDVKALLVEPTKFIREGEYLENLLDDLLSNDDLLDELQDDPVIVAMVGIIALEFTNQDGNSWYLEGDVMI